MGQWYQWWHSKLSELNIAGSKPIATTYTKKKKLIKLDQKVEQGFNNCFFLLKIVTCWVVVLDLFRKFFFITHLFCLKNIKLLLQSIKVCLIQIILTRRLKDLNYFFKPLFSVFLRFKRISLFTMCVKLVSIVKKMFLIRKTKHSYVFSLLKFLY